MGYVMAIPEEMRKKYIERRKRDVDDLTGAAAAKDPALFLKVGHQLKGNGITFGYQELADLGIRMEEAAAQVDWAQMEAELKLLINWVKEKL